MATREQFIEQLASDNRGGVQRFLPARSALVWSIFTWVLVLGATLWVSALRPGWLDQLLANPRFALETVSGLVAIVLLSVLIFRLGIPGSQRRGLTIGVIVSAGVWLASLIGSVFVPTLEVSMLGKRDFCRYEVLVYSIAPFLVGMYLLHRAYVLNWPASTTLVGITSAMVPAWLMQLACMQDPVHILKDHITPVIFVALGTAVIGVLLQRKRA